MKIVSATESSFLAERPEAGCVEAVVAWSAVKALDVAVLHRAGRLYVHQPDLLVCGQADHVVPM